MFIILTRNLNKEREAGMSTTHVYTVILAYNYISEKPRNNGGTEKRISAVLETLGKEVSCSIISSAGTKDPKQESLATQIREYMSSHYPEYKKLFFAHCEHHVWGTMAEIEYAIDRIQGIEETSPGEEVHIYISSNPGHLFGRVWLCWKILRKPQHWKLHLIKADHAFSKKEWFQEIFYKMPVYLIQLLFKRFFS